VSKKQWLPVRSGCNLGEEALEIFKTAGAVKEGHFLLASGLHSPVYWEKFRIETARQLGVRGIFAEKEGSVRVFRRDFEIAAGEHVLIVDDILTTGNSVRETVSAVNKLGGTIVGIGVLVDRSDRESAFDFPFFSCLRAPSVLYSPQECPLCAAHIPLVKPGAST